MVRNFLEENLNKKVALLYLKVGQAFNISKEIQKKGLIGYQPFLLQLRFRSLATS